MNGQNLLPHASARMTGLAGRLALIACLAAALAWPDTSHAQGDFEFGGRGGRGRGRRGRIALPPPPRDIFPGNVFTFCTIQYRSVREEDLGYGWPTEYPDAGLNLMLRLSELTTIRINRTESGEPDQVVLKLTDPKLCNYPIIFMSDVGTVGFEDDEAAALGEYLLRGGFLHADDFWGEAAWDQWEEEIGRALPPDEYPIFDIPLSHPIFHAVFEIKEIPQVPCLEYWAGTRDGTTSERGEETKEPHMRGIKDKQGRLMVVMTHNTDIADGWEREGEHEEYFREFSVKKSYPLGINIIVYAMTH